MKASSNKSWKEDCRESIRQQSNRLTITHRKTALLCGAATDVLAKVQNCYPCCGPVTCEAKKPHTTCKVHLTLPLPLPGVAVLSAIALTARKQPPAICKSSLPPVKLQLPLTMQTGPSIF